MLLDLLASKKSHLTHWGINCSYCIIRKCINPNTTGCNTLIVCVSSCSRIAPDSTIDLEKYVKKFFASLPLTTIISISLLESEYTSLLQELLHYPACVRAWMLVSRLKFKTEPVVMLLPLDSILQGIQLMSVLTASYHYRTIYI
jgi:separase